MKKKVLVIIALITSIQMYPQKILQLEECRQLALTHNKSLQMAQESVNAARELKKAAFIIRRLILCEALASGLTSLRMSDLLRYELSSTMYPPNRREFFQ